MMHKLLERQVRRHFGSAPPPAALRAFLADVDAAYTEADDDRVLLERSMDLASGELLDANAHLRRDIDRLERAEREVERQREELLQIIQSSPYGMALRRGDQYAFVNNALASCLGYQASELIGAPVLKIVHPEEHEGVRARMAGSDQGRPTPPVEVRCLRRDGSIVILEMAPVRWLRFQGAEAMLMMTCDVTERARAETALRAAEARLAALSRSGMIGIAMSQSRGGFIEANDAFLDMLGYSRAELEAGELSWSKLTPPGWHQQGAVIGQLQDGSFAGPLEKEYLRKDGSVVPVIMGVAPVHGDTNIVWAVDITDRRALEQMRREALEAENRRFQEASRLKSEFLANMSHELRTPLNAILGFSEMVHDGEMGPVNSHQIKALDCVLTSGRHLLRLINDVLDLAKVESGKLDFSPEPVSLAHLISETSSTLGAAAARSGLTVEVDIDPAVDRVLADPVRLRQVLYNYLSNAIKFSSAGGRIVVRASGDPAGALRIEVEDTGAGIKPEDLSRLFVEFQQLDGSSTKRHAGTGLGLALTRRIVEAQGGTVGARSKLGVGSVFHAVWPGARPADAASRREHAARNDTLTAG